MYLYSSHLRHLRIGRESAPSAFSGGLKPTSQVQFRAENHYSVKQKREWLHPGGASTRPTQPLQVISMDRMIGIPGPFYQREKGSRRSHSWGEEPQELVAGDGAQLPGRGLSSLSFHTVGGTPVYRYGVTYSFYGKASSYRKGSEQAHLLKSNHIEERQHFQGRVLNPFFCSFPCASNDRVSIFWLTDSVTDQSGPRFPSSNAEGLSFRPDLCFAASPTASSDGSIYYMRFEVFINEKGRVQAKDTYNEKKGILFC